MFLAQLSNKQKELFLDMCVHAANANGDFADEQKMTIAQYCDEMQLPECRFATDNMLDDVIEELVSISTDAEIRAIAVEIAALLISDSVYDDFEKSFSEQFCKMAGLSAEDYERIISMLNELTAVYTKLGAFVTGT